MDLCLVSGSFFFCLVVIYRVICLSRSTGKIWIYKRHRKTLFLFWCFYFWNIYFPGHLKRMTLYTYSSSQQLIWTEKFLIKKFLYPAVVFSTTNKANLFTWFLLFIYFWDDLITQYVFTKPSHTLLLFWSSLLINNSSFFIFFHG